MKKFAMVVFLISLLLFSACACKSDKGQITVASAGYTCDGIVNFGENFSSEVTIKAEGGGIFSLTVNKPENINGLTFSFDNSNMTVSYGDIKSLEVIPSGYGGFAAILNEIFLKFTASTPNVQSKNGEYALSGKCDGYSFEVIFNAQGFPLTVTAEKVNLKASFSNWKY